MKDPKIEAMRALLNQLERSQTTAKERYFLS